MSTIPCFVLDFFLLLSKREVQESMTVRDSTPIEECPQEKYVSIQWRVFWSHRSKTWGHRKFGLLKLRHGTKRGSSTRKQIVSHTGCVPGWTSFFFFFSFFCGRKIEENFIQIYSLPRFLGQQNEKKKNAISKNGHLMLLAGDFFTLFAQPRSQIQFLKRPVLSLSGSDSRVPLDEHRSSLGRQASQQQSRSNNR